MKLYKPKPLIGFISYERYYNHICNLEKHEIEFLKDKLEAKEADKTSSYIFYVVSAIILSVIGFLAKRSIEFMTYGNKYQDENSITISLGIMLLIVTIILIYLAILFIYKRNKIHTRLEIKFIERYLREVESEQ